MATARCFCVPTKNTMNVVDDARNDNVYPMDVNAEYVKHYRVQSRYEIKAHANIFRVGYNIEEKVQDSWKSAIINAINVVNFNVMGIFIYSDPSKQASRQINIISGINKDSDKAFARRNVIQDKSAELSLGIDWNENQRKGTAIHELLHTLGIHHEHKRHDRNKFGIVLNEKNCRKRHPNNWDSGDKWYRQYQKDYKGHGITMYDPHSIMNYVNCDGQFDVDESNVTVYYANSALLGKPRITTLSPLDKVGLNLLYPPCKHDSPLCICGFVLIQTKIQRTYVKQGQHLNMNGRIACDKCNKSIVGGSKIVWHCSFEKTTKIHPQGYDLCIECGKNEIYKPRKSKKTNLFYCGRINATKGHNYPAGDRTDGRCGPNNGANCASCRVLKNDDIPKKNNKGAPVWQGSSGYFYCGINHGLIQEKGHDGKCGPNNGPPCKSCYKLIV